MSTTRIYKIYHGMKQRCYNKRNPRFSLYGGRGITIYQEWLDDFKQFYNWSMNNGYNDNLTIDRIDHNGNYCPQNCRWISKSENSKNVYSDAERIKTNKQKYFDYLYKHKQKR